MNTIIKIGLGIAVALPLSTSITTIKDAYGIVEAPPSFSSLSTIAKEMVSHTPMNGKQLAAIEGMAGICISCLDGIPIEWLALTPGEGETFSSVDDERVIVYQSNQSVGPGTVSQTNQSKVIQSSLPSHQQPSVVRVRQIQTPTTHNQSVGPGTVTQTNQSMVIQSSLPSHQQPSVVRVRQIQTPTTQFPNGQPDRDLAKKINTSTQEFINQKLSQLPNALQPGQSPIGSGERAGREITISIQGTINQAALNGTVNTTTLNQQFNNIPHGGFLR